MTALMGRIRLAWRAGVTHLARGLVITRRQPGLYVQLVLVYSLPALVAAGLVLTVSSDAAWYQAVVVGLPWVTLAVAPVVVMKAVSAGYEGECIDLLESSRRGLGALPRYVWTNVHTSLLFWVPVGALTLLRDRTVYLAWLPELAWLGVIGAIALHQHVRTLLAPYLAVHGGLNGTRATITSWRLGGRFFWELLGIFLVGSAPVAVPLGLAYLALERLGPESLALALQMVSTQLSWVAIQAVRPVLIPALHLAYEELGSRDPSV